MLSMKSLLQVTNVVLKLIDTLANIRFLIIYQPLNSLKPSLHHLQEFYLLNIHKIRWCSTLLV